MRSGSFFGRANFSWEGLKTRMPMSMPGCVTGGPSAAMSSGVICVGRCWCIVPATVVVLVWCPVGRLARPAMTVAGVPAARHQSWSSGRGWLPILADARVGTNGRSVPDEWVTGLIGLYDQEMISVYSATQPASMISMDGCATSLEHRPRGAHAASECMLSYDSFGLNCVRRTLSVSVRSLSQCSVALSPGFQTILSVSSAALL